MGFFTELFEIFMGAMAQKSEEMYKQTAREYDDSDLESVERYRKAREFYNEASAFSKKSSSHVNSVNRNYGAKDSARSKVEEKIAKEKQAQKEREHENMIRNQYK